jgi:hypothetical protein
VVSRLQQFEVATRLTQKQGGYAVFVRK